MSTSDATTTAAPDVAAPDVAAPDVAVPDVATPDVAAPDVAAPDVAAPVDAAPDVPVPDASIALEELVTVTTSDDVKFNVKKSVLQHSKYFRTLLEPGMYADDDNEGIQLSCYLVDSTQFAKVRVVVVVGPISLKYMTSRELPKPPCLYTPLLLRADPDVPQPCCHPWKVGVPPTPASVLRAATGQHAVAPVGH